ncbi:HUWE1-associated protein modifying stress responses-like [Ornithodoros turicata]
MNDLHDRNDELDAWITNWERQCIEEVESSPDLETQIQNEKDTSSQKLWLLFQNSATCVAQLYKDRQHGLSLWVPFQNAASSVTSLYKECLESEKRASELGFQWGYQRRTRDLLAWAKKRKRHIRREDLLAFLSGKASAPHHHHHHWGSPRQRLTLDSGLRTPPHHHPRLMSPMMTPVEQPVPEGDEEVDLETFKEALALSSALGSSRGHSSPGSGSPPSYRSSGGSASLSSFIAEEFARHVESRKRSASGSPDVVMDSPTHKRSRLI